VARGFFSGVIAGTLVSGLGLGAASVLTSDGGATAPKTGGIEVPEGSAFSQPKDDTAAALPGMTESPEAGDVPQVSAPEPDDLSSIDEEALEPAAQPETGAAEGAMSAPETSDGGADVSVDGESPVLPSPQAVAPEQPKSEEELSISTDPAQPNTPDVEDSAAFPEDELAAVAGQSTEGESEPGSDVEDTSDQAPEVVEEAQPTPAEPEVADSGSEAEVEAEAEAETESEAEAVTLPGLTEPEPDTETAQEETGAPEASSTIGNLAPEVQTNRLPSVIDEPEVEETTVEEAAVEADPDGEPAEDTRPPLERYAVEFENPDAKPLMSIVLIDDGSSPIGFNALESFPYPLSFAVDASWDGAADAMATYRAAGFEVLALINLPEGAGAQDTEVAMQANLSRLPEVVAVMDGTGTGLQASREASDQLAPILLDSGHGAVLFPKGLNTAQKLLAREGVPSASVFRDFDASGQNAMVIRRFLDQAAFKAGQEEGGVLMVGRLRPDTVSALLLWGLQDRANRVALAPVSAMLRGDD